MIHLKFVETAFFTCRTVIPYAFVDVDRIQSMRGIYIATQLTPGPVGKRHLLSLITYNRGATWQRIRSPTVDNRGVRINCYLVGCCVYILIRPIFKKSKNSTFKCHGRFSEAYLLPDLAGLSYRG